jgi:HSP20 family protein
MRDLFGWDPFAEMAPAVGRWEGVTTFAPRFEVKETKDAYIFKADLPGVEEKDLDISLTGSRVTVSGKREEERRDESETYYTYERNYGTFSRSFTLPEGVDFEHCDAELKHGVLTLTVPKKSENVSRKISLKSIGEKVKGAIGGKEKGQA